MALHQRKWPLVQVKEHLQQKWLLAPHQWKLLLMRNVPKIKTQRQRVANLLTQRHRRYQSDA